MSFCKLCGLGFDFVGEAHLADCPTLLPTPDARPSAEPDWDAMVHREMTAPSAEPERAWAYGWFWDGEQFRRVDPDDQSLSVSELGEIAALAGLSIVPIAEVPSAEERAALEQMDRVPLSWLRWWSEWSLHEDVTKLAKLLLARRAAKGET